VMTFAEMKQQMEEAASRAQSRSKDKDATKKDDVQAQFKVTAKATGQTKTVQGLNAKEMQINMAMEGTDKTTGQTGAMNITTDAWYAPVPGYDEVKAFHQRMAAKLGYIFGSGMQQIAQMGAAQGGQNMSINMEDVAREQILAVREDPVASLAGLWRKVWAGGPAGSEVVLQVGRDNETLTVRVLSVDRTRFLKAPKLH